MIRDAVIHVRLFSRAALSAVSDSDQALFKTFFNSGDKATVNRAFQNVTRLANQQGPPAILACRDLLGLCNQFGAYYCHQSSNTPQSIHPIVLCPGFFDLPDTPDPCNETSLDGGNVDHGLSKPYVLLHELLHIEYITGSSIPQTMDLVNTAYGARVLVTKNDMGGGLDPSILAYNPTENTDNYALLAHWAWMRSQQQRRCPSAYPLWNMPQLLSDGAAHNELRHLLGADDSSGNTTAKSDVVECPNGCDSLVTAFGPILPSATGSDAYPSPTQSSPVNPTGSGIALIGSGTVAQGGLPQKPRCSGSCSGTNDVACPPQCRCGIVGGIEPGNGSPVINTYACVDA